jgi:hypothetical protein
MPSSFSKDHFYNMAIGVVILFIFFLTLYLASLNIAPSSEHYEQFKVLKK